MIPLCQIRPGIQPLNRQSDVYARECIERPTPPLLDPTRPRWLVGGLTDDLRIGWTLELLEEGEKI